MMANRSGDFTRFYDIARYWIVFVALILPGYLPAKTEKKKTMNLNISFGGPLKSAFNKLLDLELVAYFTYEMMEKFYAKETPERSAFAEYFRRMKLTHRDRASRMMRTARERSWPFRIRLDNLPDSKFNWGFARFAFAAPKKIEREILDATLLLNRRANQMVQTELIEMTDAVLEDQNKCLADIYLNLARLTRCNTTENESIFNRYLAYILAVTPETYDDRTITKGDKLIEQTNDSGFAEGNDDSDEDQWTDIEDDDEN